MLKGNQTKNSSKWHYSHWAMWERSNYHVSTCSNHSEGFQSGFRNRDSNNYNFLTRLSILMKKILRHAINIPVNSGKSLKQKNTNRKKYIINELKENGKSYRDFCVIDCCCQKGLFLSSLYKIDIPCKHNILSPIISQVEQMEINDEIVNYIVIKTLQDGEDKKKNALNSIIARYDFLAEKETDLQLLIDLILKCLDIKPNEPLNFEQDLNFYELFITKSEVILDFAKSKKRAPFKGKKNCNSQDNDIWLCDIDSNTIKEATKLKYETIQEIEDIYPKSIENQIAYKICDRKFRLFFEKQQEINLQRSFIAYKAECWLEADSVMKSNKFYY